MSASSALNRDAIRRYRYVQIGQLGGFSAARIDNHQFSVPRRSRTFLDTLPDHRMAPGGV
ncbi:MAG: hypothetical protein R3E09_05945 [Novosphingobium sp.]